MYFWLEDEPMTWKHVAKFKTSHLLAIYFPCYYI